MSMGMFSSISDFWLWMVCDKLLHDPAVLTTLPWKPLRPVETFYHSNRKGPKAFLCHGFWRSFLVAFWSIWYAMVIICNLILLFNHSLKLSHFNAPLSPDVAGHHSVWLSGHRCFEVSLAFDKTQLFKELLFVFETGPCYVVLTGLEIITFLLQSSEF